MPNIPAPDWFRDYPTKEARVADSDMESLEDEYTKPAKLPAESDLLAEDTDAIVDVYYTKG